MKCLIKEKLSEHKYRDNNGYLICVDSVLARTGKQRYLRSEIFADAANDDSEIEVDRKPEEVFSEKTLASFENCPLCVEHPDEDVNPDNYKDYAVGFVRDVHKGNVDGQDVILGTLVITDGKTIEEVENGQHTDLSCGYDCDIDDSENPQQRNIRGNHVALCEQGRAGNARIVDSKKVKDSERYIIYRNSGAGEMIYEGSDLKDVIEEIKSLGRNYYIIDTKDGYKKITYSEAIKMKLDSVKDEDIFKVDVSSAEDRDVSRFITEAQNIGFITDDTGYIIYLKHGNRDMLNQLKARTHTINIKFFDSYNGYYDEKEKDNWNNGYAYYFEDDDDYYRALKQVKASGQKILATGVEAGPNGRQYFVLKDSIKDSKYIVHFKHKNGGGDKDIIVEAKGMADAVEIAKTYVSDFYYKYVNVKPYFEDSYKDIKDEKIITVTLEGKTYKAIYNGMSSRYPDMADVYIPELAVLNSKYTPADDLGNHPKDGKYYIRKERIHDKDSNTVRDSIREGETYTNKNGVQLKILGINTDVTGKKYATYRIKNDTYNHPIENVENMLKANHYTKDLNTVEDSIKDSVFTFNYKDLYHNESHKEDIKANTVEEAIEELKKRVALRGIGTANVWVVSISSETETYPRGYGKLNSLTLDSGKLKDSCKKDSLVNIIKVAKVVKKYGK